MSQIKEVNTYESRIIIFFTRTVRTKIISRSAFGEDAGLSDGSSAAITAVKSWPMARHDLTICHWLKVTDSTAMGT